MSNLLLAKPKLPPDFIDVSVGEPYIVKECLSKFVELDKGYFTPDKTSWEYPEPRGFKPLVDLLEDKYQAPVVITNGAKQALGAAFYALHKMDKSRVGMKLPYWALIPPLANAHGLDCAYTSPDVSNARKECGPFSKRWEHDSYLLLAPNNPDGQCESLDLLKEAAANYKDENIPFIHDAAYFTHTYLPPDYDLGPLGDMQIFSASKMYGLSGLRLGYVVCHEASYASILQEYMEMMTVGVSSISQQFLYNLLTWEKDYPTFAKDFENEARGELLKAKKLMKAVPSEILEIPKNLEDIPGMFGWFKVGPNANFLKAKVNVIDGNLFGMPGYIRMNLAIGTEKLAKVVARLCYQL